MRRLTSLLVVLLCAAPAAAQVRIGTNADGRLVLSNRGGYRSPRVDPIAVVPRADLIDLIERHSVRRGLDPLLVRALIQVESGYDSDAVSRKGAVGLMQLMPQTAAELAVADPFDPEANVRGGTDYLRLMMDTFDNQLPLALAGYNAGPEAVRRYGGVPPYQETRNYVRRVMTLYQGSEFTDIPESSVAEGRRTYVVRRGGRLVMTNTPPD